MASKKIYYEFIHEVLTAGNRITEAVALILKEYGITEPQFNILKLLQEADGKPLTVLELQNGMYKRSSNVTRIIDKLEGKGLVSRKICPENRRKMDILLTPNGLEATKKYDSLVQAFHEGLNSKLSDEELLVLTQLMRKLELE